VSRLLVTGGCGFLGGAYLLHVLDRPGGADVTNFDALTYAAQPSRLAGLERDPHYQFIHGDLTESRQVRALFAAHGPFDLVVHFAAETHVDRSLKNAVPFVLSNVLGTQNLLDAFRAQNSGRLIHISTDEVYGTVPAGTFLKEDAPPHPRNPYAATKAASDHLVLAAVRSYGLDAWIVRSVNVYGPGQFPEKFIPLAVTSLLSGGQIPLYGDGEQVRDWLYVDDFVRAVGLLETRGRPGEIYHVAAQDERANRVVAEMLCALCEVPVAEGVMQVDDRPGHDRRYGLDAGKLRGLGWCPETGFDTGLRRTVDYFRAHPHRPVGVR
jgi:dTDP-glucose 4,6-dehydratase